MTQALNNMRLLPPSSKFSPGQLHQLRQQIQCLKLLTRGHSFNPTQIRHINKLSPAELESFNSSVTGCLIQAKSLQAKEAEIFAYDQVPGDLKPRSDDFFCQMRTTHLAKIMTEAKDLDTLENVKKELLMVKLVNEQKIMRGIIKEEWIMKAELDRDNSHACLEVALLDRDFYCRKTIAQDPRTKQEIRMVSKCEQAMRNGHEQKKKNRENQFLADLLNHHREFFDFHRKKHVSSR